MANLNDLKTNRAILFEKFTESVYDKDANRFLSNIGSCIDESDRSESGYDKVKAYFTVKSFDEFMERFGPGLVYYEAPTKHGILYSLDGYGTNIANPIALDSSPFYKSAMKMYEEKKRLKKGETTFTAKDILDDVFNPRTFINNAGRLAIRCRENYEEYIALTESGASAARINAAVEKFDKTMREIIEHYLSQASIQRLPLHLGALEMIYNEKNAANRALQKSDNALESSQTVYGVLSFTENGVDFHETEASPKNIVEIEGEDAPKALTDKTTSEIGKLISQQYDHARGGSITQQFSDDDYLKNVVVSLFSGDKTQLAHWYSMDDDKLCTMHEQAANLYSDALKNFVDTVGTLVEKVINVKAFFDHAGDDAELIITNCQVKDILDNESFKANFEQFLCDESEKNQSNPIMFAIIPAVYDKELFESTKAVKVKTLGDFSNNFDEDDNEASGLTTYKDCKRMMEILGGNSKTNLGHQIITFFNFKGCRKTAASTLDFNIVKTYKEKTADISDESYSKYAVLCYPNFTVLPPNNIRLAFNENSTKHDVNFPSLYIDSAYVACGLTVQSQNIKHLSNMGFNTNSEFQPVRFNFEAEFALKKDTAEKVPLRHVFATCLNREGISDRMDDACQREILQDGGFGFCFSYDYAIYHYGNEEHKQEHMYVLCARTLNMDINSNNGTNMYRPIFKSIANTYILHRLSSGESPSDLCGKANNNTKSINNLIYTPKCSSVKVEETMKISDNRSKGVTITYDNTVDDIDCTVEEN